MIAGESTDVLSFRFPQTKENKIKIIGVGGGGSNAVDHLFREGIEEVSFAVINTDAKALANSHVPLRIQLGKDGLGAGNNPEMGRKKAEESIDAIRELLSDGTQMVFITAGMGGGTGTGAAPIIAREAKKMGILTVSIVTTPFLYEKRLKINTALKGVKEIAKYVDSLLVINNERLRELYPEMPFMAGYEKTDAMLSTAVRSIVEIETKAGFVHVDFNDVRMVLRDGGESVISMGYAEGENRVEEALDQAINSPLMNNYGIFNAKRMVICISFPSQGDYVFRIKELDYVNKFMEKFSDNIEVKHGWTQDDSLKEGVKIIILASGFGKKEEFALPTQEDKDNESAEEDIDSFYKKFYGAKPKTVEKKPTDAEEPTKDEQKPPKDNLIHRIYGAASNLIQRAGEMMDEKE